VCCDANLTRGPGTRELEAPPPTKEYATNRRVLPASCCRARHTLFWVRTEAISALGRARRVRASRPHAGVGLTIGGSNLEDG
jgi:hypothetical protein